MPLVTSQRAGPQAKRGKLISFLSRLTVDKRVDNGNLFIFFSHCTCTAMHASFSLAGQKPRVQSTACDHS